MEHSPETAAPLCGDRVRRPAAHLAACVDRAWGNVPKLAVVVSRSTGEIPIREHERLEEGSSPILRDSIERLLAQQQRQVLASFAGIGDLGALMTP